MNEKLREEITAYYKLIKNNTIEDAFVAIAQHFYNFALNDVKREIEKRVSRNKRKKALQHISEKRHQDLIEGQLLGELKSFIEKQEV